MHPLEQDYPAISDLRTRARRRVPRSIWAFLEGGELVTEMLITDLKNNMSQIGCASLKELRGML